MRQVTVISGLERRRVWTDEQTRALVAAACEPRASVAEIARRADLCPGQLYRRWRDLAEPVSADFAAVTVSSEPEPVAGCGGVEARRGGAADRGRCTARAGGGSGAVAAAMMPARSDVRIWLATGCNDIRRGMFGLALQVQQGLKRDPHAGDLYTFRGRRGDLIKMLWHERGGHVALCEAARSWAVRLAGGDRRRGGHHGFADGVSAGGDRLAQPAHDVASASGGMT